MPGPQPRPSPDAPTLANFLWSRRDEIVNAWADALSSTTHTHGLSRTDVVDFVPAVLDEIIAHLERPWAGEPIAATMQTASGHALERLGAGFELEEVVTEFSLLRDTISSVWDRHAPASRERAERRLLHQALDRAIGASVDRYARAWSRNLRIVDEVSQLALEAESLDQLLTGLAAVFHEETAAIDLVEIFVRQGDRLVLRASSGSEGRGLLGDTVRPDEGVIGRIVREQRPIQLFSAGAASEPVLDGVAREGLRALYGVPLMMEGELLGVAVMGSRSVNELPETDQLVFRSVASRAAVGVEHQLMREDAMLRTQRLEESEARYRATFEDAPIAIAHLTPDETWTRANRRYQEIVGRTEAELGHLQLLDVVHPEDLEVVRSCIESARAKGESPLQECRHQRPDGEHVWVDFRISALRDVRGELRSFIATAQDISLQRRYRERLSALADAGETLVASLDDRRMLQEVASMAVPGLADWCAVDISDAGETDGEFVAVAHRDPSRIELLREARRRNPKAGGALEVLSTGQPVLVSEVHDDLLREIASDEEHLEILRELDLHSLLVVPLVANGAPFGSMTCATDMSGRTLNGDDLAFASTLARRAAHAISNARLHTAAQNAVRMRDRILGIVSHDLRSPLHTISLASELLIASPVVSANPFSSKQAKVIERSTAHMARLIDDLLDVNSIPEGRLTLELKPRKLARILEDAVESHAEKARALGVNVDARIEVGRDELVACDVDRVRQVLANLLGNAIKFSREGQTVLLGAESRERDFLIYVVDQGPGIPQEDLPRVFDLYWQKERRGQGAGLGLFIARGIVHAHGGHIWVKSEVGQGSRFCFTLPRGG